MSAYTTYTTQLQRLLHDSNNQFWSITEMVDYINLARERVVRDTGSYRVLVQGYISPSNETYVYGGVTGINVTDGGSGYVSAPSVSITGGGGSGATATSTITNGVVTSVTITNQGTGYSTVPSVAFGSGSATAVAGIIPVSTFDVVNLTIHWGNSRIVPSYLAWSKFNARARYYINYIGRPTCWSTYSNNSVYVQPIPDQIYPCEWDTVVQPPPIVDTSTVEVIPFPFQDPVPFYAAYLAKAKEQSWGEAQAFKKEYENQLMAALRSSFTRRTANPYS